MTTIEKYGCGELRKINIEDARPGDLINLRLKENRLVEITGKTLKYDQENSRLQNYVVIGADNRKYTMWEIGSCFRKAE